MQGSQSHLHSEKLQAIKATKLGQGVIISHNESFITPKQIAEKFVNACACFIDSRVKLESSSLLGKNNCD